MTAIDVAGLRRETTHVVSRHHGVRVRARSQVGDEHRVNVRHVAGDDEHGVTLGFRERGVKPTQRSAARYEISDVAQLREPVAIAGARAAHHQNIGRDPRQLGDLTFQDRLPVDDERTLVLAAEAARSTAGENSCTVHASGSILPPHE
jgi:hypothetical protein